MLLRSAYTYAIFCVGVYFLKNKELAEETIKVTVHLFIFYSVSRKRGNV